MWEHPNKTFECHLASTKHKTALQKRLEVRRVLAKGNVYKQAVRGSQIVKAKRRLQNRSVIKKIMKTVYFIARKKWAVRENFADVIDLVCELGNEDINIHLQEASKRAMYTSVRSVDSFVKTLSDNLEAAFPYASQKCS